MAFSVPTFPLAVGIWTAGVDPTVNPPRVVTVGNLSYGRRSFTQFWDWAASGDASAFAILLLPALTDVRDVFNAAAGDTVEVPLGTGRYYAVQLADDVAKGFPNEYRMAMMVKDATFVSWPSPMP